jgi:hypothetical protein
MGVERIGQSADPISMRARVERDAAIDRATEDLRVFYRDGRSSIRVVIDDIDEHVWEAIEAPVARRWPAGDVKVEYLTEGLCVEWVRSVPEARDARTIPVERRPT